MTDYQLNRLARQIAEKMSVVPEKIKDLTPQIVNVLKEAQPSDKESLNIGDIALHFKKKKKQEQTSLPPNFSGPLIDFGNTKEIKTSDQTPLHIQESFYDEQDDYYDKKN